MKTTILFFLMSSILYSQHFFINKYTFKGEISYNEVLTALATKSKRSVVGDNDLLKKERLWYIDDKDFFTAIEHVRKNLFSDGFDVRVDSGSIYIFRPETTVVIPIEKPAPTYRIFLPYSRQWLITQSLQDSLNAIIIDSLQYIKRLDSLSKPCYQYRIYLKGFLKKAGRNRAFYIDDQIRAEFDTRAKKPPFIPFTLNTAYSDLKSSYNFDREIVLFSDDSSRIYHFGTEIRRVSSKMESQSILTESYETVFDGLTVAFKRPGFFHISYRVGETNIDLSGVPDSLIGGSAIISESYDKRSFRFLPSKQKNLNEFHFYCKIVAHKVN